MSNPTIILDRPEQILALRELTIYRGLKREIDGMRLTRGVSCYALAKKEYGLRGNKAKVLAQLRDILLAKYPFLKESLV